LIYTMRKGVIVALAAQADLGPAPSAAEKLIEPLVVGWERIFTLSWEPGERRGRPVVWGTIVNDSPYIIGTVQLLLDTLDGQGRVVDQQVSWGPTSLTPFSHAAFEIPVKRPAANYRVRVLAYDRLEFPSRDR
jgi:hypothetical protein